MDKDLLKGFKISLGFVIGLSLFLGIVYAVGFHQTSEIVPGMFQGDYTFNGSVNIEENAEIRGNLNMKGNSINNSLYKGVFNPHTKILNWSVSGTTTFTDIDVGLDSTNAKYLVASVFSTMDDPTNNCDHVVHLFGYDFPNFHAYGTSFTNNNDPNPNTYTIMVHNGDSAGCDHYGMHKTLFIPLKDNQRFDVKLSDGYTAGTHNIKLRTIAYIE